MKEQYVWTSYYYQQNYSVQQLPIGKLVYNNSIHHFKFATPFLVNYNNQLKMPFMSPNAPWLRWRAQVDSGIAGMEETHWILCKYILELLAGQLM